MHVSKSKIANSGRGLHATRILQAFAEYSTLDLLAFQEALSPAASPAPLLVSRRLHDQLIRHLAMRTLTEQPAVRSTAMLGSLCSGEFAKMARQWTHAECFKFYNVRAKNPRWSWSGRSDDGSTVAVTLWQDRFSEQGGIYRNFEEDQPGEWRSRPGFVELLENLKHAKDNLGGTVRVILAKAKDPSSSPRSIERCWPQANLVMRVDALDMEDGKFALQRIEEPTV